MAAAAAAAVPACSVAPKRPLETLRIAVVGLKSRGTDHIEWLLRMDDVDVAAIVDIDEHLVMPVMRMIEKRRGKWPAYYKDIRRMLGDKSIDAVTIATTNHTHALFAIWAMQAGKHVYLEKPVSHNPFEGRKVVEAARKYNRICQAGIQSRSMKGIRDAIAYLHAGTLGKVKIAHGLCYKRRQSLGRKPDGPVPEGVDYDLWLGPAPVRPFNPIRFHYNWHWFWDYGNGDIGNQGAHEFDRARWGLNKSTLPTRVISLGGRLAFDDDGETPNTQIAWFDYGDAELVFEVRGLGTDAYRGARIGVIWDCEHGTLVSPDYKGATAYDPDGKAIQKFGGDGDHMRNFLDAVRSGRREDLNADIEEGHLSACLSHLANVSYRLGIPQPLSKDKPFGDIESANEAFGRMREHLIANELKPEEVRIQVGPLLTFNPWTERFLGNENANTLLRRTYRPPFVVPDAV
jgi:predicted dehydrogenase